MSTQNGNRKKLRVAHLYQAAGLKWHQPQAAQLHIFHTLEGLQRAGHRAYLMAVRNRKVIFTDDLEVFHSARIPAEFFAPTGWTSNPYYELAERGLRRMQTALRFPYLSLFDSLRLVDACTYNLQEFDLIHERYNLMALGGTLASRRLGIPLFLEVNADLLEQRKFKGRPETGLRKILAVNATKMAFQAAAKIICISQDLKVHLHQKWGVPQEKLTVLPCAADVNKFGINENKAKIRREYDIATEPVIIWVGGFYEWHDLSLLINSFARVNREIMNAKLILVGDGDRRAEIEQAVAEKGLAGNVIFTGELAHGRMPDILAVADVAVAPSAPVSASQGGTGTPLKIFEYLAAGKPIIATQISHTSEVIRDGFNGLLVKPGDEIAFAGALLNLLKDKSLTDRLSQNARTYAEKYHSWDNYTKRLEAIYREAL